MPFIDPDSPLAPPHDFEIEQGILGELLRRPDALDDVASAVDQADFTDPDHGKLFAEIEARRASGIDGSLLALRSWADEHMVGKAAYLARVFAASHAIGDVAASARLLADLTLRRSALGIRDAMTAVAADQSASMRARFAQVLDHGGELAQRGAGGGIGLQSTAALLPHLRETAEAAYKRGSELAGIATGFANIDFHVGGLVPGNLYVLAGRPSHGKSALAVNIAEAVALAAGPVAFFSLEMSAIELLQRLVAQRAGVAAEGVRRGTLSEIEMDRVMTASHALAELALFIDGAAGMTLALLAARVRSFQRRQPDLALVVVDHLQIIRPPLVQGSPTRNDVVGAFSRGLKELAKELALPVLALCQLSRASEKRPKEDHRPQLADLRDSGNIEQDADVVMFVHREVVRLAVSTNPVDQLKAIEVARSAEIIIAKNRHGRIAVVPLDFDGPCMRFTDLSTP